jgi:hypothetical protein
MTAVNEAPARAYISTIRDVREVALRGTADLAYWRDRLRPEGLTPFDENGRASLLLTGIEAKFRGIPFRELSISLQVSEDGATPSGAFLAYAFNSSRLLALAERVFFQTPYHRARLTVDEKTPARLGIALGNNTLFAARMDSPRPPSRREAVLFDGPIYLPGSRHVFYARLSGPADVYPFQPEDSASIVPNAKAPIFAGLLESGFKGTEWLARAGAVHARSRTYRRPG